VTKIRHAVSTVNIWDQGRNAGKKIWPLVNKKADVPGTLQAAPNLPQWPMLPRAWKKGNAELAVVFLTVKFCRNRVACV